MKSERLGKGLNTLLDSVYKPTEKLNTSNPPNDPDLFKEMNTDNINPRMSKRFYAACSVIQGIMSSNECGIAHHPATAVKWAYAIVDELIKQENS